MKTPEDLAEEYAAKFTMWDFQHDYRDELQEAFLAGYAAAKQDKGLVASAMRRQGLDPDKAESNNAELAAISGKRFEEDLG